MEWLTRGWDQAHWVSFFVGVAAGAALVFTGASGLAEVGGVFAAVGLRWAIWQIPPPGRSKALGTPPGAWSRLGQLAVTVLLVTLALEIVTVPIR